MCVCSLGVNGASALRSVLVQYTEEVMPSLVKYHVWSVPRRV